MKRSPHRDAPLTARQRALVESVRAIIVHVATSLARRYPSERLEDLMTLGEDGAVAAAQDYREQEGASFSTFAWARIWGAAKNGIARERRAAGFTARLADALTQGRRHAMQFAEAQRDTGDPFHDGEDDEERRVAEALAGFGASFVVGFNTAHVGEDPDVAYRNAEIRAALATLKERDDAVVSAYVFDEKSFAEIAAALPEGVSPTTVQRRYHAAMGRLAKRLARVAPG